MSQEVFEEKEVLDTETYQKKKLELIDKVGFRDHFKADKWEDFNRDFFDGLAHKYDALNEVLSLGMHRLFKKRAVHNAGLKNGDRVLDLCTGSGDIALYIAKKYPGCRVVGADVSKNMLEIARKRGEGISNLEFIEADALNLPFENQSFDVTFISFGLRNLFDLKEGILEMKRVTRAGGRVVNLDLGKPKGRIRNALYTLYFLKLIPFLGRTVFHRNEFNSFKYLPESGKYFPAPEELLRVFSSLGFEDCRSYNFMFGAINQQIAEIRP
ncbi:MAG: ubiquinone/menaquinone biosynthesis methyltransferase [Candidatus Omnitrophica bacterium]|nr:ubiquinone/menaquinone biosynthesis methyltransferase [Candidatus Omnitrophota bacterium]